MRLAETESSGFLRAEAQKAACAYVVEDESTDVSPVVVIENIVLGDGYSLEDQNMLLEQAKQCGIVPSAEVVEKDLKWSTDRGQESYGQAVREVVAKFVRLACPAVAILEQKRVQRTADFIADVIGEG